MMNRWIPRISTIRRVPPEYQEVLNAVKRLAEHPDPVFHEFALRRMAAVAEELRELASGEIVFHDTEAWRVCYERVLQSLDCSLYRSVSWVKSHGYWDDYPGRQSIQLNYQLIDRGLRIERIVILGSNSWSAQNQLPKPYVRHWIEEQHYRGVSMSLVLEGDLEGEPDLLHDFGIYGDRAIGEHEFDAESRTVRFSLRFDGPAIHLANDHWDRLQLFAIPYQDLLDRVVTHG